MKSQKVLIGSVSAVLILCAHSALASAWQMPPNPGLPDDFMGSVENIANWLLGFVTLLSVLAIIWGGTIYVASSGDEDRTRTAKKTIKYAIMGLAMAGLAYAIVTLVVKDILVTGQQEETNTQNGQQNSQATQAM